MSNDNPAEYLVTYPSLNLFHNIKNHSQFKMTLKIQHQILEKVTLQRLKSLWEIEFKRFS
jgi:hypothetical protein